MTLILRRWVCTDAIGFVTELVSYLKITTRSSVYRLLQCLENDANRSFSDMVEDHGQGIMHCVHQHI
jgi:hypothetical protein